MEDDPNGEWLCSNDEEFRDRRGDAESIPQAGFSSTQSVDARRMEIELYRREKEVTERELELARREIEMMRNQLRECAITNENFNDNITRTRSVQPRVNITAIADLLSHFDGKSANYNTWESQIRLLKTTYQLEDDAARLLIGMRLKDKALEWLHSKPEYVAMPFDVLLGELRAMFQHRRSRVTTRKIFEERIWRKDETFHEYVHEKIIMGNRVPIDGDEMLEYIVDGISNDTLRNQARIQRFEICF